MPAGVAARELAHINVLMLKPLKFDWSVAGAQAPAVTCLTPAGLAHLGTCTYVRLLRSTCEQFQASESKNMFMLCLDSSCTLIRTDTTLDCDRI